MRGCPDHLRCISRSRWTAPGWHPAAWREPAGPARRPVRPPGYWADLVAEAERGLLDFVTIEDSLGLQSTPAAEPDAAHRPGARPAGRRAHRRPGRAADAGASAWSRRSWSTHTEPFHLSKAIATLDYVSSGRAGVRVQVSARPDEARTSAGATFRGAADRDATTQRSGSCWPSCSTRRPTTSRWSGGCGTAGRTTPRSATPPPAGSSTGTSCTTSTSRAAGFSVKGPSITPRPPQGQPLVAALAHAPCRTGWSPGRPTSVRHPARRRARPATSSPRSAREQAAGRARGRDRARLGRPGGVPRRRPRPRPRPGKARLDDLAGDAISPATRRSSPARRRELADLLLDWQASGLTGFRLRPAAIPHDLTAITRGLVPELQRRGRVPQPVRGRHPARPARPAPPGQPLRRRLSHALRKDADR